MKIGNFDLKGAILAPMAGFTDIPFRDICFKYGAAATVTEMVSAKAIEYGSEKSLELFKIKNVDEPVGVQMFGSDADCMARVTESVFNNEKFAFLDINMGCPVRKIVKNGEGSALMKEPKLVYDIVSKVKKVSNKPVSVKLRLGFDEENINVVEIAKVCEDAGADFIAVHARTRAQMYSGIARIEYIKKVKDAVKIPVIGNGDIKSPLDAINMIEKTGCDLVMIARGAQGNPIIFKQIRDYLEKGVYDKEYLYEDRVRDIKEQSLSMLKYKGEYGAIIQMRKHIVFYLKGLKNATEIKMKINSSKNLDEIFKVLDSYKDINGR